MTTVPTEPTEASTVIRPAIAPRLDPRRWALASAGVLCVVLAIVGVFVPGLPTTIFLIAATWCFARSCPALERKLIQESRILAPFRKYAAPGARMPRHAMAASLVVMWVFVATSTLTILAAFGDPWRTVVAGVVLGAAVVGTAFVIRAGRRH